MGEPVFLQHQVFEQWCPDKGQSEFGSGETIHARRNKDKVSSALRGSALSMGFGSVSSYSVPAIRKIGVTPPNMSDLTKRRQDEWDKQNALREKQKELKRLVEERKQRLSGNGN